jgi:hypothetical protein
LPNLKRKGWGAGGPAVVAVWPAAGRLGLDGGRDSDWWRGRISPWISKDGGAGGGGWWVDGAVAR